METLRYGSSGDDVKKLQAALHLKADGIFGLGTKDAVTIFQRYHRLTPDGIAGEKTLMALGLIEKKSYKGVDANVIYSPLSVHISRYANREIRYLVIHFTGGSNSKSGRALACKNTFEARDASADFAVDDEQMVQFNPDPKNYFCWAVGGKKWNDKGGSYFGKATNGNCISIELCSTCTPSTTQAVSTANHKGWSFTEATLDNAATLAAILLKKYNIPIERMIRHYDVTGKLCPGVYGWNDEPLLNIDGSKTGIQNNSDGWKTFKDKVSMLIR